MEKCIYIYISSYIQNILAKSCQNCLTSRYSKISIYCIFSWIWVTKHWLECEVLHVLTCILLLCVDVPCLFFYKLMLYFAVHLLYVCVIDFILCKVPIFLDLFCSIKIKLPGMWFFFFTELQNQLSSPCFKLVDIECCSATRRMPRHKHGWPRAWTWSSI